jgi:hypothetical protein
MRAHYPARRYRADEAPASWQDVFFPLIGSLKGS